MHEIDEGIKDTLANAGMIAALTGGAAVGLAMKQPPTPVDRTITQIEIPAPKRPQPALKVAAKPAPQFKSHHERLLATIAKKSGIEGIELAAFLSQMAHETQGFKRMVERGVNSYFNRYEPRFSPKRARALGNTEDGDGLRYKGRGYIQLTGRYNYTKAGHAIGEDLANNPKLLERPEIAAEVAVWYWQNRVQPKVRDFSDVRSVTRRINPGLSGLSDREDRFEYYENLIQRSAST